MMTLTETLQLKEKYLQFEDLRALDYCEKRWREEGTPVERWAMVNFIEKMLKELKANGIGYPKVLLLRKKEIQRREFVPGVAHVVAEENSNISKWIPQQWIKQANRESREVWEKQQADLRAKKNLQNAARLRTSQRSQHWKNPQIQRK
jgi:hypothetical protein